MQRGRNRYTSCTHGFFCRRTAVGSLKHVYERDTLSTSSTYAIDAIAALHQIADGAYDRETPPHACLLKNAPHVSTRAVSVYVSAEVACLQLAVTMWMPRRSRADTRRMARSCRRRESQSAAKSQRQCGRRRLQCGNHGRYCLCSLRLYVLARSPRVFGGRHCIGIEQQRFAALFICARKVYAPD